MSNARRRVTVRRIRLAFSFSAIILAGVTFACAKGPDTPPGAVHVLTTDGDVNPVMVRYLDRGIDAAEDEEAGAVVIRLDTPGGLVTSMDDIIKRILEADVPVIVYVWPSGGHAASAGTYITYASHVAAMAPATQIGAATPINASGEDIEGDLRRKVINDAVAKIRGLAELRGRNADWAEDAVRNGAAVNSSEALELGVVEYVAEDLEALLDAADGREVRLQDGRSLTLSTAGARVAYNDRTFIERLLEIIADPNIAFLLLSLGTLGLFIELLNPGSIVPGVFGAIALLTAFFALSVLPFNWAGVALIMLAFILFGLELFVTSGGVLGVGGAVALVLGGFMLTSGNEPGLTVSPWLIWTLAAVLSGVVLFVLVNVFRVRRMPPKLGLQTVVGHVAVARSPLDPEGLVFMDGEYWTAEAEDGNIQPGESVIVTQIKGLRLRVRRQKAEGEQK